MLFKIKYKIYKSLLKARLVKPKVILLLDGGICSQMHQYLLGQLYAQNKYLVRYDLTFYKEWGSDLNRQFVRNFDLLKAFPYLKLKTPSSTALFWYKKRFYNVGNNTCKRIDDFSFLQRTPPVYLGGYYHLPADIWLPAFHELFRMEEGVLDSTNAKLCDEIDSRSCSVGVHVRRGDLKVEVYDYGVPASLDYFAKAVSFFKEKESMPFFYFFSDEPDWVRNELLPSLQLTGEECKVVDLNGSDKGYMDLFLMAHCKHQITSKGTLGKYGAILKDNPEKIVILCDDEIEYSWKDFLKNPVFI